MAAAEASNLHPSISLESLSYRWLVNPTTSSTDESDEGSFIEMDPRLPPSKRFNPIFWNNLNPHDFKFDFPEVHQTLVPADELFAEGQFVLPFYESSPRSHESIPKKAEISKRVLRKYLLGFFRPLCLVSQCYRGSRSRVEDETAKKTRFGHSDEWSRSSCDSESSIHEAVLHCKRSSGTRLRVL